jgi:asparagine synthase (glutamine-hydrolysing)
MNAAMVHRGPDDDSAHTSELLDVAIGARRRSNTSTIECPARWQRTSPAASRSDAHQHGPCIAARSTRHAPRTCSTSLTRPTAQRTPDANDASARFQPALIISVCGICGSSRDHDGARTRAMARELIHRGPDDGDVRIDPRQGVAIGARRLSIIDVEGGRQPIANEDGTVWAALNGEIYNYPQLRAQLRGSGHTLKTRCDTEALVHLYEDYGPGLVHALEGMFALVIWDSKRGELVLARDRFGEKPLFYDTTGGELSFASELSALQSVADRGSIDPLAIQAILTLGYVPGPRTMYTRVRQLSAGHVLRWPLVEQRAIVTKYWEMPASVEPGGGTSIEDLVDEAHDLLDRSVASRLIADVPVGVLLSGGLDSTLVAALASRHTANLKTFTVAYDSGVVNEDGPARVTAGLVRSEHHELRLTSSWVSKHVPALLARLDQPIADPAFVALAAISQHAREHVKVVVGGEGADELFFGYPRYRWLARATRLGHLVPASGAASAADLVRRVGARGRLGRLGRMAEVLEPAPPLARNLEWITDGLLSQRNGFYGPRLSDVADRGDLRAVISDRWPGTSGTALAASRFDQRLYLCDDILQKADRASMWTSLEMRTPYLDRTLAEFSATVAPEMHMSSGGKHLLRQVLRRVLPSAGVGRKKTAFRVPLADWLRGPLGPSVGEHVLEGRLVHDGWIDPEAGRRLVAHLNAGEDTSRELWPLLCAGAWLDAQP